MIDPSQHIMFAGRDWQILKSWLLEQRESKVGLLIAATDHDKSNKVRGALECINSILALELAADKAASRNF